MRSCFGTADAVLPHDVMYVIHCIEQKSVQTVADSLVEELWRQVEALKKGFTGRKKTNSSICFSKRTLNKLHVGGTLNHRLVCLLLHLFHHTIKRPRGQAEGQ